MENIFNKILPPLEMNVQNESWPIAGNFKISRGAKQSAEVITVQLSDGEHIGRGECVPYSRYNETLESVKNLIVSFEDKLNAGSFPYGDLISNMPAGAARNAIDCAVWDYIAKKENKSVADMTGLSPLTSHVTAYTISLDTPEVMAENVKKAAEYDLLKIKLGGAGDDERMLAVREAAPGARLIADANEAWTENTVSDFLQVAEQNRFELIEQPLPENEDAILSDISPKIPVCADESCHMAKQLNQLKTRYQAVNIKLDKTGGFTEALKAAQMARSLGLKIMVGCMVGTSLAMAPALLLARFADWIDLDGPLLLKKDRDPGLSYSNSQIHPPSPSLWG